MTPEEINRQAQHAREKALEHFPFKLIETTGSEALAKWQDLKSSGHGFPVVLGGGDQLGDLLTPFGPYVPLPRPLEEVLKAAADIKFPDDLARRKKEDAEKAINQLEDMFAANPDLRLPRVIETDQGTSRALVKEDMLAAIARDPLDPPLGEWPASPDPSTGLSVARDVSGKPLAKVYIGLAQTDDWTIIPAFLRWGGWNACPVAEYHVAAMRLWRDRYGAELVGMNANTINLRVALKPKTRDEALALARDQYVYCSDIIDQGAQTYSALAADLMANDWWYFWWD